jgi:VCBS repeat-containing protein
MNPALGTVVKSLDKEDENFNPLYEVEGPYGTRLVNSEGQYGYFTHFGGLYVCYTDGHYCDCVHDDE